MTSDELNKAIDELDSREGYTVRGLEGSGKVIPYIGWFWLEVDFDRPISLGHCGQFAGFMENNKWGYPSWELTPEQNNHLKELLEAAVISPSNETLQAVFDYVQSCSNVEHRKEAWVARTNW